MFLFNRKAQRLQKVAENKSIAIMMFLCSPEGSKATLIDYSR